MKTRKSTHWNYRVVTKIIPGPTAHDLTKGTVEKLSDIRVYSITEVYYENGKPVSYVDNINLFSNLESIRDLKWTRKKIKKAFKKPILDLDNWPKKYYPYQKPINTDPVYN